ncbi:MAG: alpha/beta hydrolase-fold protein, partial [Crocinitomicaceae bacterium]
MSLSCSEEISESHGTIEGVDYHTGSTRLSDLADVVAPVHPSLKKDTTIFPDFQSNPIEVIIKFPSDTAFKGTIIALPGWNYDNNEWCEKTELCEKALSQGYALILPEMGKSIYCDSVFPETRKDWLRYPTRSWMKETLIPRIQEEFQLLLTDQDNFVMGLSTGARGAVLLAMDLPEIFSACGALSGDFDQTRYTKDKLYNGYYGPFQEFQDRWIGKDNAISSI